MSKYYDAKDIKVLEGLDAVRLRPGMYIGTTGPKGLHHILWEIVDNSMDEIANGFGDRIDIVLYADGSVSVEDNGRGIPVDIHPQLKVSAVQVVFTQLHAGGKFDNENYAHSGGLHGVGASVTNALSEWLTVEVYKGGYIYRMEFESKEVGGVVKGGLPKGALVNTKVKTKKHGTMVRFKPDARIFETTEMSYDVIRKHIKEQAFLNKGATISLRDEREETPIEVTYKFDGGIVDFITDINSAKVVAYDKPVYIFGEEKDITAELALQYTDGYTCNIFSYVNNIPTTEGGTHETGFKSALTKVMNDVAHRLNVLKNKDDNFKGEDFLEGISAVLSIKMKSVQFEGQTKTKLGNPEARVAVEHIVVTELSKFFEKPSNRKIADAILKKALVAMNVREEERKAKELARKKNTAENFNLVGKLSNCSGRKAEDNELYIVEGDSAGGTCKQARNRHFQAILPLRGKPLNAEKKRTAQVLDNVEIRTIISALGCGIGESDYDESKLNFHKVIILSDADQDGGHIRAILLTFFYRYMRKLITGGHVYIGMPPLYKVYKRDIVEYAYDDDELEKAKVKVGRGYEIQRYKGLGEMNAEQLWETTMDPKRRTLVQVCIEDAAEAEKLISVLMGDAVEQRKAYIVEHANFNREDNFSKE